MIGAWLGLVLTHGRPVRELHTGDTEMQAIDATNRFPTTVANQMDRLADLFAPIVHAREVCAGVAIIGTDFHAVV